MTRAAHNPPHVDQPKTLVVGIAGGTGSGKTTLSRKIEAALADREVLVIPMDRYFRRVRPHMIAPITGEDWEDHNHPESMDLPQLVSDLDLILREGAYQVVIVEGLFALHFGPLRQRLDLGIYLDAPADERIVRRLKRNMDRGADFDGIARFYLDSVRFRHQEFVEPSRWHADIVLNGSYPSQRGTDLIVDWIRAHSAGDDGKGRR
ncbi:MAG: AAA family ATPase [Anaerolineae bacterium]|nr:AAA family ATPase [Anaerolineae bacterium]